MKGEWHGGKGPTYRPESEAGAFERGYENINWNARSEPTMEPIAQLPPGQRFPIPFVSAYPTGSRFTVTPPVLDTDDDWLVLVKDLDVATRELIESDDFAPDLDGKYEIDGAWHFRSFRGPNKLNLIVTDDITMYLRSVGATLLAKQLNLKTKDERIALFREIKFGGWPVENDLIFDVTHYKGPLP